MKNLKELQKEEAIKRMQMLHLYRDVIDDFAKRELIFSNKGGCIYTIDDQVKRIVRNFETKHNALVYYVIHNCIEDMEMYSLLFVSKYPEEWGYDQDDIQNHRACVYVYNCDEPAFSEFGSIGIRSNLGGIARVC